MLYSKKILSSQEQLINTFNYACNWNAMLYAVHKVSTTILTFTLFRTMSTQQFSLYANSMSSVFLLLLWLDFGCKKSIARFLPEYTSQNAPLKDAIRVLLTFKVGALLCAAPLCSFMLFKYLNYFAPSVTICVMLPMLVIFIAEGIISILQLIYHAFFLNKYFNIIHTAYLISYTLLAFGICTYSIVINSTQLLLYMLLLAKAITSFIAAYVTYYFLQRIKPEQKGVNKQESIWAKKYQPLHMQFAKHSLFMWVNTTIKSISERNGLILILTYFFGPASANIFKVANEGALLFHRIIFKTIGTNDTALLTHAKIHKYNISHAIQTLKEKVSTLWQGAVVLFIVVLIGRWGMQHDLIITQLFMFMTICYLIEFALSPYERILEVEQQYRSLFYSYAPYCIVLLVLCLTNYMQAAGLLSTIIVIHLFRVLSMVLIRTYAYKQHILQIARTGHKKTATHT